MFVPRNEQLSRRELVWQAVGAVEAPSCSDWEEEEEEKKKGLLSYS